MRIGSFVLAFAGAHTGARGWKAAGAAEPACAGVRLEAASELSPDWTEAARRLREELASASEASCAAVTLSLTAAPDGGAHLVAVNADGRRAERTVARPSVLAATAVGLVASIPHEAAEPPAPPPPPTTTTTTTNESDVSARPPLPTSTASTGTGAPAAASLPAPARTEIWLGVAMGARLAEPTAVGMIDFEGRIDAIVRLWLLSLSLRYSPSIGPDASDTTYEEIVFGLGAGRRVSVGSGALNVSLVPSIATTNLRWKQDEPTPQSASSSALRVGLAARWSAPLVESWRLTLTGDVDVSPSGLAHAASLGAGAPALPVWSAGLRVGASGALL